ncbi:MAG: pitrilysin family protein [Kiritimatiellae bacterium]|nr:pitrilysin family protein [Kiritimatiellia bacterium]
MLKNVKMTKLDNGLTVLSTSDAGAESVAAGIWVRAGGRHESAAQAGFSHFLEHMLFKGTPSRNALEITRAIEGRGGYMNAYTQEESACYYVKLPYELMEEGVDVLSDMYMNSLLSEDEIAREREVILEEIKMYQDIPHYHVQEILQAAMFRNHALGRPLAGSEESLSPVNHNLLQAYKEQRYRASATLIAFAGRVDHNACVSCVDQRLGALPAGEVAPFTPLDSSFGQDPLVLVGKGVAQVQAVLGFRIFGRHDPRRFALRVLNGLLGENMSSRLFQSVRERQGLCYSIQSGYQLFDDGGIFSISGGFDSRRAAKALQLTIQELKLLINEGVDEEELRRTKEYLLGTFRLGLESMSSRMNFLGESYSNFQYVPAPEVILENINSVNAADVQCLAGEILTSANMTLAMVAPARMNRDQARWLDVIKF